MLDYEIESLKNVLAALASVKAPNEQYGTLGRAYLPALVEDLTPLKASHWRAKKLLKRIEWSGAAGKYKICPACENTGGQGHKPDCELAALIGEKP